MRQDDDHAAAADRSGHPVLRVQGVTKRWPGHDTPVLQDVDLGLGPGASASISGRNGAGKTTLLRIVAGLIKPDTGTVRVRGADLEAGGRSYKERIGLVSAGNSGLFARLRVQHHLEYGARLAFMPRARQADAVQRMLETFWLRDLAGRRVDRLSMGQRQRVRIALAFLHGPELLLLDEPQTSLDDEGVAILREALEGLFARGGAALWASPAGEAPVIDFDQRFVVRAGRLEAD